MADGQELDNLLIKVDSELGDLKGIESAISALERLAQINKDTSKMVSQLGKLGTELHKFDNLKLDGLKDSIGGVHGMISALQKLTTVTGTATKSIGQLGKLGDTLRKSFDGIGHSLDGIDKVSVGVLNLVDALDKLANISGSANGAIRQLGSLGGSLSGFKDVNPDDISKLVTPIKELVQAIGTLGNNNTISIRLDNSGVAHVNQVVKNTKKNLKDFTEFWQNVKNNRASIDLSDMFDLSQSTEDLQKNLNHAQRMLSSYENQARTTLEKLHDAEASFSLKDLVNDKQWRKQFGSHMMADAMVDSLKEGIDKVKTELEGRGAREIEEAWRHTQESIIRDSHLDLGELVNPNLPLDQIRANLRTLQNELSKAEGSMRRSLTELNRLRSLERDENVLRSQSGYRTSAYTYATNTRFVEQYREAIRNLNRELREQERISQSDVPLLRELPTLQQQLTRYQEAFDKLSSKSNLSDEQQRNLGTYERGIEIIQGRIQQIHDTLEQIPQSEEGVLEMMRQVADEAERAEKATEKMNQDMRDSIGKGFGSFGNMLSGSGNKVLGSFGNLSNMFGKAVSNGTAKFSEETLSSLQSLSSGLGKLATGIGQVVAVANVAISVFKAFIAIADKAIGTIQKFITKLLQFAKNMLTHVVGAFNAVVGAIKKSVSVVESGAKAIASAIRKMGEMASTVVSIFGKLGSSALSGLGKGAKAIANLITPKTVKNLISANGSIKNILKNVRLLNKAIQIANKWFTMLTRMLMRKIVQAFISNLKDAFDQLVLWEKDANDEMLRLNINVSKMYSGLLRSVYQLVAAFEPLINAMATPVEAFLDSLSSMGENLARFMAILTGQPYYLRVKKFYKDYGEQVEDTNKKVKNLTNGLDELNILNDSKDSEIGWNIGDYIEKVPVDGTFDGIKIEIQKILDWIKDKLRNIDWDWLKEKAREWVKRIFEIINTILRDKEFWQLLGKTIGELVNFLFTIINEAVHDLDWKALGQAIAELIKNALETLDWALIRDTVVTLAKGLATTWNEIFADKQLWKDIGETVAHVINDVIVAYLDTFAWNFDFKNMADSISLAIKTALEGIDWEQIRHAIDGWTKGITDAINEWANDKQLWDDIGETIKHTINDVFINAFNDLGDIDFASLTERLKEAITKALDINWDEFNEGIEKWTTNIADVINGFFTDEEFLTKITTSIANLANSVINGLDDLIEKIKAYDIGTAIANAIGTGLSQIDWDTAFTLPSDAINKLSEAIRGMLDSIPEDFNLGTWLAEHLSITLDGVDWELIHKNVEDFATNVSNYINGLLADKEFWKKAGGFAGETLDVVWDLTIKPLANVNLNDLVDSIKTAIKEAWGKFNFEEKMGDLGGLTQKIIDAVDNALTTTDWRSIGKQIGSGISAFLDKINPESIAKTIFDAFVALSDTIGGTLEKMLENGDFYKIGQIIANAFYGMLGGLAYLLDTNSDEFSKAINQLSKGIVDFLDKHEDEIAMFLNKIIDAIGKILSEKSKERHALVEKLADIIKKTNLGDLLGIIIAGAIKLWIDGLIIKEAVLVSIAKSFGGLVSKILGALKPYLINIISSIVLTWLLKKFVGFLVTAILSALGVAGLPALIAGAIATALASAVGLIGGWELGDFIKGLFGNKDKKDENTDYKEHWWEFWKEEAPEDVTYEPTVTIDPKIDDSNLEGINWDDYFQDRQNQVIIDDPKFGTITASKIESEEFAGKILNVDEINAQVLNLGDIFADKLKVKEIEVTNGTDEVNNELDKFYAGTPNGAEGGVLGAGRDLDTITTRFLEVTEKTTTPLLEVGEKITTPLLEVTEKITSKLLEITEKIKTPLLEVEKMFVQLFEVLKVTTPLLEAEKLTTKELEIASLKVTTLLADNINTTQIKTIDIIADRLKVGVIDGQLSGGIGGTTTINLDGGSSVYDWMFGDGGTVEKPTFTTEDRWSDISGLPSAEDFLNDLSDTYGSILDDADATLEGYTTKYELPTLYADNETDATIGEITQVANEEAMKRAQEALGRNGFGNGGLYDWAQSDSLVSDDVKALSTRAIETLQKMADGSFLGGNYTLDDVKHTEELSWLLLDSENARLRGESTNEEVDSRYQTTEDWLNHFGEGEEGEEEEKKDEKAIKNVDEFNVLGDETTGKSKNPLSFLENLPLMTEYIMAQVYDIIDKWLRRIYKLLKSFEVPESFLDLFKDMGFDEIDGEIRIPILEEISRQLDTLNDLLADLVPLVKELKDSVDRLKIAIDGLTNTLAMVNGTLNNLIEVIRDLINKLEDIKAEAHSSSESWSDAIDGLIDAINGLRDSINTVSSDTKTYIQTWNEYSGGFITSLDGLRDAFNNFHIDTWKSSNDELISSIRSLGDKLTNIKCECTCCCNCNGCDKGNNNTTHTGNGGQEPTGHTEPNRGEWYDDGGDPVPQYTNNGGYEEDTRTHTSETNWAEPTSNDSGDGGWINNDGGDEPSGNLPTPEEALERGLDLGQVEEETDTPSGNGLLTHNVDVNTGDWKLVDAEGNVLDFGNIYDKEEQEKNGIGRAVVNLKDRKTTLYDKDGNVIGEYDFDTKKWSGDNAYTRAQEKAEQKAKERQEQIEKNRQERLEREKEKSANTPVIDANRITWMNGVTQEQKDQVVAERTKQVEELRNKAKDLLDKVNKYGTEEQKTTAQKMYDSLMTNIPTGEVGSYEYFYKKLWELATNKVKDPEDIGNKYLVSFSKAYATYGSAGAEQKIGTLGSESKLLRNLLTADDSQLVNSSGRGIYFKDAQTGATIKDSATLSQIKNYLIDTYGLTSYDASNQANDTTSVSSSTSSTSTSNSWFGDKFKSIVDSGSKIFANGFVSALTTPMAKATADSIFNGKSALDWIGYEGADGTYRTNKMYGVTNAKELFDYWYKNRFLVKGYQMGGIPNSGEIYMARENGSSEFIGSFGNRSVVANNDQIVTAVANGVAMANDGLKNAIEAQTNALEQAIDRKDLEVTIGDRQIAEANRRGEQGMGTSFVK